MKDIRFGPNYGSWDATCTDCGETFTWYGSKKLDREPERCNDCQVKRIAEAIKDDDESD